MAVTTKTRYDIDFFEWTKATAELVRARRLDEVDLDPVAEEMESLGNSDRRAAQAQMTHILFAPDSTESPTGTRWHEMEGLRK